MEAGERRLEVALGGSGIVVVRERDAGVVGVARGLALGEARVVDAPDRVSLDGVVERLDVVHIVARARRRRRRGLGVWRRSVLHG